MAYTPLYIATTDIDDSVARDFVNASDTRIDKWMERTDNELIALAQSLGVPSTAIKIPVNSRVKEYLIAYFCFLLFQAVNGENESENPENEVHLVKLKWYSERVAYISTMITKEMIQNDIASIEPSGFIRAGVMWRG